MSTLKKLGAASAAILKTLIAPQVGRDALADSIGYVTNAGVPSAVVPEFIGQHLFDTTNSNWYKAYGVAAGNWILSGVTATADQINAATLAASNTRTITGTDSIVAGDHGKVLYIDNATGFVTTLPAPIAGFKCEVISKTANTSGNHTIVTASSANVIKGNQNSVAGDAGDSGTADDTISFVANQSVAGDRVEIRSDGTSWFAYATSRVAAGITFTQAS